MSSGAEWAGKVGETWAGLWRRTDLTFAGLAPFLDAAIDAVAPGEGRALDIGCGAGATAIALAQRHPRLAVTGLDISATLVGVARERGAGLPNLAFQAGDAAAPAAAVPFDLVVSRHGVMFFDDPPRAFSAIRAAAAPGAPLVFSCFRRPEDNPWLWELVPAITGAPPPAFPPLGANPFAFADAAATRAFLAQAGWSAIEAQAVDYPYLAGEGGDALAEAVTTFRAIGPAASAIAAADPAERPARVARLRAVLAPYHQGDRVALPAAAWIWSARA